MFRVLVFVMMFSNVAFSETVAIVKVSSLEHEHLNYEKTFKIPKNYKTLSKHDDLFFDLGYGGFKCEVSFIGESAQVICDRNEGKKFLESESIAVGIESSCERKNFQKVMFKVKDKGAEKGHSSFISIKCVNQEKI